MNKFAPAVGLTLVSASVLLLASQSPAQIFAPATAAKSAEVQATITTEDRARKALQIARLAAKNEIQKLSLRAVRDSLAGGPPVKPISISTNRLTTSSGSTNSGFSAEVETALSELDKIWGDKKFEPAAVYETLKAVVMPAARPQELFLYPKSLSTNGSKVTGRSVGDLLVKWANRAKALEDLQTALQKRLETSRSKVEGLTLLAMTQLRKNDTTAATTALKELRAAVQKNTIQFSATTAAHAALPALSKKETAENAIPLLQQVVDNLTSGSNSNSEPAGTMMLMLAEAHIAADRVDTAEKLLDQYLTRMQLDNNRYSGDYGLYRRQQQLNKVGKILAGAGRVDKALQQLGMAADIVTQYSNSNGSSIPLNVMVHLASANPADGYKLLRASCMPKKGRQSIRHMYSGVSDQTLPKEFAELSKTKAQVINRSGVLPTIISSAELLVRAAAGKGELKTFTAELTELSKKKVENATPLLVMALAAESATKDPAAAQPQTDLKPLAAAAKELTAQLRDARKKNNRRRDMALDCVAAASLAESGLPLEVKLSVCDALYGMLTAYNNALLPSLFRTRNAAIRHHYKADEELMARAAPGMWTPLTVLPKESVGKLPSSADWIVQEGVFAHTTGACWDSLYFRWPLSGSYTINYEFLDDGWAEGDVTFAGLWMMSHGHSNGLATIRSLRINSATSDITRTCQQVWRGNFVPGQIRVTPDSMTWLVNGHEVYRESRGAGSFPWFGFITEYNRVSQWRNVSIDGDVKVPAEVRLSDDKQLRGWASGFYGSTRLAVFNKPKGWNGRATLNSGNATEEFDWNWTDGEIVSKSKKDHALLQYLRPLQSGEQITWEFQSGENHIVHPQIGRLAFLLNKDKLQLRWAVGTDAASELKPDNLVDATDIRSQNGPLPLKDGWNTAKLVRQGNRLQLSINDQPVAEREMESDNNWVFGFYKTKEHSARIRNVVLTGDWPQQVDEQLLAGLSAPRGELLRSEHRAIHLMMDEKRFANRVIQVVRQGRKMSPEKRYEFLRNWVIPGDLHEELRAWGDCVPVGNAEPTADEFAHTIEHNLNPGGQTTSPLQELIAVAKQLGRTSEIRKDFEAVSEDDPNAARNKSAAMALLEFAEGKPAAAQPWMHKLDALVRQPRGKGSRFFWPDVLASEAAINHVETRDSAMRIMRVLVEKSRNGNALDTTLSWHAQRTLARWKLARLADHQDTKLAFNNVPGFDLASMVTSETSGQGRPAGTYRVSAAGEVIHESGSTDFMLLKTPLMGDFEMSCEVTSFDYREPYIGFGGLSATLHYNKNQTRIERTFRSQSYSKLKKTISVDRWYEYRMVVKGKKLQCFVDGERIYSGTLPNRKSDPWMYVESPGWMTTGIRNIRFSGSPNIPKTIRLLSKDDENLTGWSPRFYWQSIGPVQNENAKKKKFFMAEDGAMIAVANANRPTREAVAYYHRPMFEDGAITWNFPFKPGKQEMHPAIGRLAFILHPDGVREHWLSAGKYERSGLMPTAETVRPEFQLAKSVNLKDTRNQATLKLAGDTVTLIVNGEPVYRRDISPDYQRKFGFFHYTNIRGSVRNVVWKGDWPKTLPDLSTTPVGSNPAENLIAKVAGLKERRSYNLTAGRAQAGLPIWGGDEKNVEDALTGLKVTSPPKSKWKEVILPINYGLRGDFDIMADYKIHKLANADDTQSHGTISVRLSDESKARIMFGPIHRDGSTKTRIGAEFSSVGDKKSYPKHDSVFQKSGRLRLIRVGPEIWCLIAKSGSDEFRIVEAMIIGDEDIAPNNLRLNVLSGSTKDSTTVEWQSLTVRAEEYFDKK